MDRGSSIRTFNPAKKFAEEVLHPLIKTHTEAKIKTRLGAISEDIASTMTKNERFIKRFNGMKERIILQQTLLTEVEPTIILNGRKSEIELVREIKDQLSILEDSYDDRTDDLLVVRQVQGKATPTLTKLFKEMGEYLDKTYIQLQRLMTKNKLLFFGDDNEYLDNEQLMERIKSENRRA